MRILFFGSLGETLGRSIEMTLPPGLRTVGELRHALAERHPDADLTSARLRVCLDDEIVPDEAPIRDADELAFLPPLSGG